MLYNFLDNGIVGESFAPRPNDPIFLPEDVIINGKLVKNTLSGNLL